ncbi:MAG: hypothetical protein RR280_08580 [Bacteroidaceae bacterium]
MSNSVVLLKTAFGQTVELVEVTGNMASVLVTKTLGTSTFLQEQAFHVTKLFNLDGSPFTA